MKCKFCNKEKDLIKAHIIPYSFFKNVKGDDGRLFVVDDRENSFKKRAFKGFYDEELVCRGCEGLFADCDNYAKKFFFDTKRDRQEFYENKPIADIYNKFNYDKLMLFFVSMLWRASASKHDSCKAVRLGKYQELAKQMILSKKVSTSILSVILHRFTDKSGNIVRAPGKTRLNGFNYYGFHMSNFYADIKVDSQIPHGYLNNLSIKRGKPIIMTLLKFSELKIVKSDNFKKIIEKIKK